MVVLRPQFRGSADWGRKLWMAGDAEWGQKMQDDKDDGAQWMIDQKIAQPGHIAMFGFSYGGYRRSRLRCVPMACTARHRRAGVSDIKKIWSRFYTNPFFRQAQAPTVAGLNPVDKAGEMKIPLMVYHGDRDRTVPIEQSEWFVNKARVRGSRSSSTPSPTTRMVPPGPARSWVTSSGRSTTTWAGCGGGGL
jgi:dipeptidyl aminopeptidase/acylaminoacyl peptidase